jgi:broad specificity phosphatase PhoE
MSYGVSIIDIFVLWTLKVLDGESQANVEHLIVSDPDHGKLAKYGLTDKGRQQARAAAIQLEELWKAKNICPTTTTILTSCFSRARETAEIIAHRLNVPVVVEPLLRER